MKIVSVGLRNTKECSMSYRQSRMYKLTTYLLLRPGYMCDFSSHWQRNGSNFIALPRPAN